jgi:hypothetical protein
VKNHLGELEFQECYDGSWVNDLRTGYADKIPTKLEFGYSIVFSFSCSFGDDPPGSGILNDRGIHTLGTGQTTNLMMNGGSWNSNKKDRSMKVGLLTVFLRALDS